MEATGNWGLDLADFLHGRGVRVSVVNPARIKAYGESELARNKTDRLDAALIARFCRAQLPPAWAPPAPHLRELRELVRRCDALKAARVQELNRQKSGFASPAVARSIAAHLEWLDGQIEAVTAEVRQLVQADPTLSRNLALLRGITGFGEVSATVLLAELPNIAEFTPKALAAFAGLSPSEHSSGSSVRRPGKMSRTGSDRLRGTLYMCALSAKRTNKALAGFVLLPEVLPEVLGGGARRPRLGRAGPAGGGLHVCPGTWAAARHRAARALPRRAAMRRLRHLQEARRTAAGRPRAGRRGRRHVADAGVMLGARAQELLRPSPKAIPRREMPRSGISAKAGTAPVAAEALARIAALYRIEEGIRGKSPEERLAARRERSKPLVDDLGTWLKAQLARGTG